MAHERSIFPGATDYTGLSYTEVVHAVQDYAEWTDETISDLKKDLELIDEEDANIRNVDKVRSYVNHFISMLKKYSQELKRISIEMPSEVLSSHAEAINQIYRNAKRKEGMCVNFKKDFIETGLPSHKIRWIMDKIYSDTRGLCIDFRDLSNLKSRVDALVGSKLLQGKEIFEIHPDDIESFSEIKEEPVPSKNDLKVMKSISENRVKEAIAEIISEPTVPKDWGGESSDLFTTHLTIEGRRTSAAFLLKGPSKFHPMKAADLGKNGDQINRLYTEPAELLVLQHCHEVTPPVRTTMQAFSNQEGRRRRYCIIDGYDTLRILRAYSKCGQQPTSK